MEENPKKLKSLSPGRLEAELRQNLEKITGSKFHSIYISLFEYASGGCSDDYAIEFTIEIDCNNW
ncbi:hypothetical protein ACJJIU_16330 [Microbulbifer sp. CnH-101-E]|uniref:hypothetical protein n=1 Tax=unclassified Microbulbifer TaxID=2619833 RepID=UPI0040390193